MLRFEYVLKTVLLAVVVSLGAVGCSSHAVSPPPPTSLFQLKAIAGAYRKATSDLDHAPQNKEELLPYLKEVAKGYDPPSDVLRSKVDGEEFVIHWGFDYRNWPETTKFSEMPVLAYEKNGTDGKRAVVQLPPSGAPNVSLKTEEELAELKFPAPYKSPT